MRKRVIKKIGIYTLCVCMGAASLGCSSNKTSQKENSLSEDKGSVTKSINFDDVILKVGKESVTYREMLLYMMQIKNNYEPGMGTGIWDFKFNSEETFEDMAKDEVVRQVTQLKVMVQEAKELNVELSKDEKADLNNSVKAYLQNITKDDQDKYGMDEEVVYDVLKDNYLAEKIYSVATNEVNTNVSDEEAKQMKFQQIVILTKGTDKDGKEINMNEKQKKNALKRAKRALKKAQDEKEFTTIAKANSDLDTIELTMGKGDNKELESVALAMQKGDISDVITTSTGYVILHCTSTYDEDATNQKKEDIIANRQETIFKKKYEKWSEQYKVTLDSSKWNSIKFD